MGKYLRHTYVRLINFGLKSEIFKLNGSLNGPHSKIKNNVTKGYFTSSIFCVLNIPMYLILQFLPKNFEKSFINLFFCNEIQSELCNEDSF